MSLYPNGTADATSSTRRWSCWTSAAIDAAVRSECAAAQRFTASSEPLAARRSRPGDIGAAQARIGDAVNVAYYPEIGGGRRAGAMVVAQQDIGAITAALTGPRSNSR